MIYMIVYEHCSGYGGRGFLGRVDSSESKLARLFSSLQWLCLCANLFPIDPEYAENSEL